MIATFRRACDKRLRLAVETLADFTRHWHPWAREGSTGRPGQENKTTPARSAPWDEPG